MRVYCPHCGRYFRIFSETSLSIADIIDSLWFGKLFKECTGDKLSKMIFGVGMVE